MVSGCWVMFGLPCVFGLVGSSIGLCDWVMFSVCLGPKDLACLGLRPGEFCVML